jgi:hypothetical protein
MNRELLHDQMRRIRREEERSPVDNAFYALAALSQSDRDKVAERFNHVFVDGHKGGRMVTPRMCFLYDNNRT